MSSSTIYVWIYLPGSDTPVIAGKHVVTREVTGNFGEFTYAKNYLNNNDAIAIDPIKLPLSERSFQFNPLNGYPSSILDACPDNWGIRIISLLKGEKSFPSGYLLMNDPGRVGALAFSESPNQPPIEFKSKYYSLDDLLHAAELLESDQHVDEELLKALLPGTGGARPKCNIVDDNSVWIAKFPSLKDGSISIPKLEHATMSLAKICGVDVATTKIIKVGNKDVLLVKRFDREKSESGFTRKHFISGRTIFYSDPNYTNIASYQRLAKWIPKIANDASQQLNELYRRLVFNVAVRNSDDHELNHGFIHQSNGQYQLSPAFDVLPNLSNTNIHRHALLIGSSGAGTIENLLDIAASFNLTRDEATSIIVNMELLIKNHQEEVFYASGFGVEDINKFERYFKPIPENSESINIYRP